GWKERPRVAACLAACAPPGGLSVGGVCASTAAALGRVHGRVGGGEHIAQRRYRQFGHLAGPNGGGQRQRHPGVVQRPVECGRECVEVGGGHVADDGHELVPAQATGGAMTAAPGAEPVGDCDEGGVSGGVAVRVVER